MSTFELLLASPTDWCDATVGRAEVAASLARNPGQLKGASDDEIDRWRKGSKAHWTFMSVPYPWT